MEKIKEKEKNIVEETKDKVQVILFPREGVSIQLDSTNIFFKLGSDIYSYKQFEHEFTSKVIETDGKYFDADRYNFIKYPITVWVNEETGDQYIDLIKCEKTCIWKGQELIGMLYEDFLKLSQLNPDHSDKQWSSGPYINDRNYYVYNFDSMGLMLWVWRKRIRQILINSPEYDQDE